jgi:hypothetical protein
MNIDTARRLYHMAYALVGAITAYRDEVDGAGLSFRAYQAAERLRLDAERISEHRQADLKKLETEAFAPTAGRKSEG